VAVADLGLHRRELPENRRCLFPRPSPWPRREPEHVGSLDRDSSGPARLQKVLVGRRQLFALDEVGVVAHHEESEAVGDVLPVAAGKGLRHDVAQRRGVEILEQALAVERLDPVRAGLEHVGLVAPGAGFGQGAADDLLRRAAPMVDPDPVLLLERGGERLAVGDGHGAVEHTCRSFFAPATSRASRSAPWYM